jgi:hypothetical protein
MREEKNDSRLVLAEYLHQLHRQSQQATGFCKEKKKKEKEKKEKKRKKIEFVPKQGQNSLNRLEWHSQKPMPQIQTRKDVLWPTIKRYSSCVGHVFVSRQ